MFGIEPEEQELEMLHIKISYWLTALKYKDTEWNHEYVQEREPDTLWLEEHGHHIPCELRRAIEWNAVKGLDIPFLYSYFYNKSPIGRISIGYMYSTYCWWIGYFQLSL